LLYLGVVKLLVFREPRAQTRCLRIFFSAKQSPGWLCANKATPQILSGSMHS